MGNSGSRGVLPHRCFHYMMNTYRHIKTGVQITTVCTLSGTAWEKVEPEQVKPEPTAAPAVKKKTANRRKAK